MSAGNKTNRHGSDATRVLISPALHGGKKNRSRHSSLPNSFGKWIAADGALDVRADLTFRQVIAASKNDEHLEWRDRRKIQINDKHATDNISHFLHRLNYSCYRSAYKRYGKRIKVSSAIQGGVSSLRNERGTKRLHAHLLLEKPNHIGFDEFRDAILENWLSTKWGYEEHNIEMIYSLSGSAAYQVRDSVLSFDIQNTDLV